MSDAALWPLERTLGAPAHARTLLADHCLCCPPGLPRGACDTALLLVTELVTNAVRHGGDPLDLQVTDDDQVFRVEVTDHGSTMPVRRDEVDPWSEGGRGLMLVETLSDSWGVTPAHPGKTVWFELPPFTTDPTAGR